MSRRKALIALTVVLFIACLLPVFAAAAEEAGGAEKAASGVSMATALLAIGAAIAIGLTGLATCVAQARIGAAGIGAIAENRENMGLVIILLVIPETVVIFGFVVAAIILFILK